MADAVFTIAAEIEPQLDERAAQQQATKLANQINGVFAKEIKPAGLQLDTKAFKDKITEASNTLKTKLGKGLDAVKRGAEDVGRAAKTGFIKFTDAINLTNSKITTLSKGFINAIRDNNKFKDALKDVGLAAGDALNSLPQVFKDVQAEVISGIGPLQRAAQSGNEFAQAIIPITDISVGISRGIEELGKSIAQLSVFLRSMNQDVKGASDSSGNFLTQAGALQKVLEDIGNGIGAGGKNPFNELAKDIAATTKGKGINDLLDGLKELKTRTGANTLQITAFGKTFERSGVSISKLTGPLGFFLQKLGLVDKDARKAALAIENEVNRKIRGLSPKDLSGYERLKLRLEDIGRLGKLAGRGLLDVGKATASGFTGLEKFTGNTVKSLQNAFSGAKSLKLSPELDSKGFLGKLESFSSRTLAFFKILNSKEQDLSKIDFTSNLVKAQPVFNDIARRAGILTGTFQKAGKETLVLGSLIATSIGNTKAFNVIKDSFSSVANGIKNVGKSVGADFADVFKNVPGILFDTVKSLFNVKTATKEVADEAAKVPNVFQRSFTFVQGLFAPLITGIKNVSQSFFGDFIDAAKGIPSAFGDAFSFIKTGFADVGRSIAASPVGQFFKKAADSVTDFGNRIKNSQIVQQIGVIGNTLKTGFSKAFEGVGGGFVNAIKSRFNGAKKAAVDSAAETEAEAAKAAEAKAAQVAILFKFGFDAAQAEEIAKAAETVAQATLDKNPLKLTVAPPTGGGAAPVPTTAAGPAPKVAQTAAQAFAPKIEAPDTKAIGTKVGKDISAGLEAGLAEGEAVAKKGFLQLVKGGIEDLIAFLGIASPSKLFQKIGQEIVAGLTLGLAGGDSAVRKALKGVADVAVGTVQLAFQGLAQVTKIAGAALGGLTAVAIGTGAQFNILQQVVSNTLPTILGSAAATDKLLKSVNDLNDTSPFARSSFLQLTQTLAGFGVQADKITPAIDAIQQAVAATGGGEQDLLELGTAFAKIASTGRLTGDILQSFTVRGIDAVGILGQQFGKTSGEIQDMISKGLLPAQKAIDGLTVGLSTKFKGATDAVAKNLPGALDRVRAKIRNFGAALTSSFINPKGGGALVDTLNNLATALDQVTKKLVPVLQPALKAIGDIMVSVSGKIAGFAKTLSGAFKLDEFNNSTGELTNNLQKVADVIKGNLGPALLGISAVLPGLLSGLPVVGGLFEGLSGVITGVATGFGKLVTGAIGPLIQKIPILGGLFEGLAGSTVGIVAIGAAFIALLATSKDVQKAFSDLFKSLTQGKKGAEFLADLQHAGEGAVKTFKALQDAIGPFVAVLIKSFEPIIRAIVKVIGQLFDALQGPIASLGHLLNVLSPIFPVLGAVVGKVIEFLGKGLKPLGDALSFVIDLITFLVVKIGPPLVGAFEKAGEIVGKFAGTVKDILGGAVKFVINGFKTFIGAINKALKFFHLPEIKIDFNIDAIKDGIATVQDVAAEAGKAGAAGAAANQQHKTAVDQVTEAYKAQLESIKDAAGAAVHNSELASKQVDTLKDTLKTTLQSTDQLVSPLFDAAKAFKDSQTAITDARKGADEATQASIQLQKDYAKALRDVIKPADELAKANRDLQKTQFELQKTTRDQVDLQRELADLTGQDAADKRAALDRAIERAQIALNKANRDALDLQKQLNDENSKGVNLSGLTLDQARTKLTNAKFSLAAQQQSNATETDAAAIADDKRSKELDVLDAIQAQKDAVKARADFELENANAILDNKQQQIELEGTRQDLLLQQVEQENHIKDLQAGETAQAAVILDFNKRIKDAKDAVARAQKAVTDAVQASKLAEAQLAEQSAIVRGDVEGQASAQAEIWRLKGLGLNFDKATDAALKSQLASVQAIVQQLKDAQKAADAALQQKVIAENAAGIADEIDQIKQFKAAFGEFFAQGNELAKESETATLISAFTAASNQGALLNSKGQAVQLTSAQIKDIAEKLLNTPGNDLLKALKDILARLGLTLPGFATGYAPSDYIQQGKNDGKGLVRMFEYGREAVLPLTNKMNMMRVVNDPTVLPAVLDALPRISLSSPDNLAARSLSEATIVHPQRGGGQTNYGDRRREAKEFAGMVGDAVRGAVGEALKESGGLGGADVDINVHPATDQAVLIAREVKRQVEKIIGRP